MEWSVFDVEYGTLTEEDQAAVAAEALATLDSGETSGRA